MSIRSDFFTSIVCSRLFNLGELKSLIEVQRAKRAELFSWEEQLQKRHEQQEVTQKKITEKHLIQF